MAANKEANVTTTTSTTSPFQVPSWAGKGPQGLHLDVSKQNNLIEKLIIDEKPCYLFGRNKDVCDFNLEHTSCSRVHAALVFHKHLKRSFLVDLNSTHGTFIGQIRLEPHKPTQVQVESVISFGASTRTYVLREKPTVAGMSTAPMGTLGDKAENSAGRDETATGGLLGLPESDTALDDLTEFNTAHNKRATAVGLSDSGGSLTTTPSLKRRRKSSSSVTFRDGEEIINPEDIDPSVGRFRNMVQTSVVIPTKRIRGPEQPSSTLTENITKRLQSFPYSQGLYSNLTPTTGDTPATPTSPTSPTASTRTKLSITSAPDVTSPGQAEPQPALEPAVATAVVLLPPAQAMVVAPAKKKYAKEAWPGKKPTPALLI